MGRANVTRRLTKRLLARRGFARSYVNKEGKNVGAKSDKVLFIFQFILNCKITFSITANYFYAMLSKLITYFQHVVLHLIFFVWTANFVTVNENSDI